jgi:hypothetical protein
MNKPTSSVHVLLIFVLLSNGLCHAAGTEVSTPVDAERLKFDTVSTGQLPAGVQVFSGTWSVRAEKGTPTSPHALCQSAVADYPAIVLGDTVYSDGHVTTAFKTISGKEDQAAGIIFRVQDKDNYYILRANALEDNVILFKYVKGRRIAVKEGNIKVAKGAWQELMIMFEGSHILGYLNGKLVVNATDSTFKSGKVGLWTKADSQTCFDYVSVTARQR